MTRGLQISQKGGKQNPRKMKDISSVSIVSEIFRRQMT